MNVNLILNKSGLMGTEYDDFSKLFSTGTFNDNNKDFLLKSYYVAKELLDTFKIYHEENRPIDLLLSLGYYDDIMQSSVIPPTKYIDRDIVAHVAKLQNSQKNIQLVDAVTDQVFTRGFDRNKFIEYFDIYLAGIKHVTDQREKKKGRSGAEDEMIELGGL